MDPTSTLGASLISHLLQIIFSLPQLFSCCHAVTIRPAGEWGLLAHISHQLYVGSCFWSQPPRSPWPSHLASSWGLEPQPSGFSSPSAHTHHPGFEFALIFLNLGFPIPFKCSCNFKLFYCTLYNIYICVWEGAAYICSDQNSLVL